MSTDEASDVTFTGEETSAVLVMFRALMTKIDQQTTTIVGLLVVKMNQQAAQMKNLATGNAQVKDVVAV